MGKKKDRQPQRSKRDRQEAAVKKGLGGNSMRTESIRGNRRVEENRPRRETRGR